MTWPFISLGDLCEIQIGKTPSRAKPEYWRDGTLPWLSISDMNQGRHLKSTKERLAEAGVRAAGMKAVQPGTILLSYKLSIGKVGVAEIPMYTNEAIAALTSLSPKIDTSYLYWALQFIDLLRGADRAAMGATLNKAKLTLVSVPVPPLPEQRRIATILDKADALRAKRRAALAELDGLAQAIFLEMFGDPVDNPRKWDTKTLESLCGVGSSKRVFVHELVDSGVPFYRGTEIGQLGEGKEVNPSLFISKDHYERLKSEAGVPSKGDLLLPSICPDGRIYLVNKDDPFYYKDARVLWIRVGNSALDGIFLRHYLKSLFAKKYSTIASGTTFAELKIFALKILDVQLPPLEMQHRFARAVEAVEAQILWTKSSLKGLDQLFDSIQHRAFRGEL